MMRQIKNNSNDARPTLAKLRVFAKQFSSHDWQLLCTYEAFNYFVLHNLASAQYLAIEILLVTALETEARKDAMRIYLTPLRQYTV